MTNIEHPDITKYDGGAEYIMPDVKCPHCGAKLNGDIDIMYMDACGDTYCSHCVDKLPAQLDDQTECGLCHAELDDGETFLYYTIDGDYLGCDKCVDEYDVYDYIADQGAVEW